MKEFFINIFKKLTKRYIITTYELSNKPIELSLKVWANKKPLILGRDFIFNRKNNCITLL